MAYKIIRPRHGIKSLWDTYKSRIYKIGEMLVESPESGVGSGQVNIKFGDGVTDYENLPYAVEAPISQLIEGSTKPMTSGAGYDIQAQVTDAKTKLNKIGTMTYILSGVNYEVGDYTSDPIKIPVNLKSYQELLFEFGSAGIEGASGAREFVTMKTIWGSLVDEGWYSIMTSNGAMKLKFNMNDSCIEIYTLPKRLRAIGATNCSF